MLVRRWDGEGGAAGVYVAVAMAKVGRFGERSRGKVCAWQVCGGAARVYEGEWVRAGERCYRYGQPRTHGHRVSLSHTHTHAHITHAHHRHCHHHTQGVHLHATMDYQNYVRFESFGAVRMVLTVSAVPMVWAHATNTVYTTFPVAGITETKTGIIITFEIVGRLGTFSFSALVNALLSGVVLFGLAATIVDGFCQILQELPVGVVRVLCCCCPSYGEHLFVVTGKYTEAAFEVVCIDSRAHWRKSHVEKYRRDNMEEEGAEEGGEDGGEGGGEGGGKGDIEFVNVTAEGESGGRGGGGDGMTQPRISQQVCVVWRDTGKCEFGDKCHFFHETGGGGGRKAGGAGGIC